LNFPWRYPHFCVVMKRSSIDKGKRKTTNEISPSTKMGRPERSGKPSRSAELRGDHWITDEWMDLNATGTTKGSLHGSFTDHTHKLQHENGIRSAHLEGVRENGNELNRKHVACRRDE
jgi:hypothetical protein